ncbi:glycosyltransferase [Heliobacterium chlorum]|uniref:Glycosyltransferase n=1 Tax=Heliobacterium chlorum TaxID=2698 RepID=A0ABR7SYX1_HELCL|nr:glycosyltransferase [Heliobacterium chlorum]MBC9783740.1 glycosyltransferase [Heliobacterium chlorum]
MCLDPLSISLCMIVKDEASHLHRCLKSVSPFVDEIVIVDTGSIDETPDIALSFGATLIKSPWKEDFSAARNESIRQATKQWILFLDADEELPQDTAHRLRILVAEPEVEGWNFTVINVNSPVDGHNHITHTNLRLFRNRQEYRFEGKIHEQILPSIRRANLGSVIHSQLPILHHGYNPQFVDQQHKAQRNIRLLEKEIRLDPHNAFHHYNLGVSYSALGVLNKALDHFHISRERLDFFRGFEPALYRDYGRCLYGYGEYELALEIVNEGLTYFSDYPDLFFLRGCLNRDLNRREEAIADFSKCLLFRKVPYNYPTEEGITGSLPHFQLAESYAQINLHEKAIEHLLQTHPKESSLHTQLRLDSNIRKILTTPSTVEGLRKHFFTHTHTVIQLLYAGKHFQPCLDCLNQLEVNEPILLLWKIKCLIHLKRFEEAEAILNVFPHDSSTRERLLYHCLILWLQDPPKEASPLIRTFFDSDSPLSQALQLADKIILNRSSESDLSVRNDEIALEILSFALEMESLGYLEKALLLRRLYTESHDIGEAFFLLGKLSFLQGNDEKAYPLLVEAVANGFSDDDEVHFLLGKTSERLTTPQKALHHYLTALKHNPANESYAASALEQMAKSCFVLASDVQQKIPDDAPQLRPLLLWLRSIEKKAAYYREALLT